MPYTRCEIRSLGEVWNDAILWYAKGVREVSARPVTQKTSWRYLAAMHDFHRGWWEQLGYLQPGEVLPPSTEQRIFWKQCQHGSWYFLPWHRAYLLSFEAIVRDAIASLGGPADTWALPYWNYNGPAADAMELPPAFAELNLPDGSPNPLHVTARYLPGIMPGDIDLKPALSEDSFIGASNGPMVGFGGPETAFSEGGSGHGLLESRPHDMVHGDLGGENGLMSYPESAALDPIFWLHHCNIDRLWEVWRQRDAGNVDPTEAAWLNGPADRVFAIFGADGNPIACNPGDMASLPALGYDYDDVSDPLPGVSRRGTRLGGLHEAFDLAGVEEPVAKPPKFELLGSSDSELPVSEGAETARVAIAARPERNWSASFNEAAMAEDQPGEPDRVFLVLENIRGTEDARILDVYVHAPGQTQEALAGSVSLFGLDAASDPDGAHGGGGLSKTLEVTGLFDQLRVEGKSPSELEVRIAPRGVAKGEDKIRIGQISLHRQAIDE